MKMINILNRFFLAAIVIFLVSCSGTNNVEPAGTINSQQLEEAFTSARSMGGLKSLVVSHNGTIIKEEYFNGANADDAFNVMSVTKSVTSLLIGLAIEKGLIPSVEENISTYLSNIAGNFPSDKAGLKINHLITMSGGFQGNELTEPGLYNSWYSSENKIQYILNVPLVYQPGTHFSYDSRPYHLLSVILARVFSLGTKEFAERNLFTPMGIGARNWIADQQGYFNGSSNLFLKARDMVKIGELVLHNGTHSGVRVINSDWINQLKQSMITTNNAVSYGTDYSYGWWLGRHHNQNFMMAMGWGGQFIIVVPGFNLVITASNSTSGLTNTSAGLQWQNTVDLIMTRVLTSFN